MKVSAKLRYTVRTLCEIGETEQNPVALSKIEGKQKISRKYLKQILQPLEKKGIIGSIRGKNGGYYFKKKIDNISLYDVVSALNENINIVPCSHNRSCSFERIDICGSQGKWEELQNLINDFYKRTTISEFEDENYSKNKVD